MVYRPLHALIGLHNLHDQSYSDFRHRLVETVMSAGYAASITFGFESALEITHRQLFHLCVVEINLGQPAAATCDPFRQILEAARNRYTGTKIIGISSIDEAIAEARTIEGALVSPKPCLDLPKLIQYRF